MTSAKYEIIDYLKRCGGKAAGGTIERYFSDTYRRWKPSYISRVCRKLAEEGRIIALYEKASTGRDYVIYSLPERG